MAVRLWMQNSWWHWKVCEFSLIFKLVGWTLRFVGSPRVVGRSKLWGSTFNFSFWMNMETLVLHFVSPSILRGAVGTCQVKQYSFGERSGTEPPKTGCKHLQNNKQSAGTAGIMPPSLISAIHFSILTLSATNFLGGGKMLGWERWGKE